MTGKRAGHDAECWNIPRGCSQQPRLCVRVRTERASVVGEGDE